MTDGNGMMTCPILGAEWERRDAARRGQKRPPSSRTTEVIYRRELRPVITTGAEVMDQIFRPKQQRGSAASATG